jgi:PAS domain S-box-containing protein
LVFLLGVVFLAGWILQVPDVVHGQPGVNTIPPSGALGFLLSGAGLAAVALARRRWAALCGGGAALVGGANIAGHLLGNPILLDGLFFRLFSEAKLSVLGGMPPGGAVSFLLAGAGILSAASPLPRRWRFLVFATTGMAVAFTGILARTGFIGQAGGPGDVGFVPGLPALAALNFLVLGIGLIVLGIYGNEGSLSQEDPASALGLRSLTNISPTDLLLPLLGAGLLLGSLGIFVVGLQQSRQSQVAVHHTLDVIIALGLVESAALGMQTEERGFVIAGKEELLTSYQQASKGMDEALSRAQRLTADNPELQKLLGKLLTLRQQWGAWAEGIIAVRRSAGGAQKAQALVAAGRGRGLMARLQEDLDRAQNVELRLLAERKTRESAGQTLLSIALLFCVMGGILVGMTQFWLARRLESQRRILVAETASRAAAELRFRRFVELAPHAMVIVDPEGRIQLVNSQVLSWFGYSRDELVGQPVELLLPERFRHGHPAYRRGFVQAPTSRPMGTGRDLFGLRKDGTEFPVDISLSPVETPEGLQVIASVSDMTERRQAEEDLKQSNHALEAANQELDAARLILEAEVAKRARAEERSRILLDQAPQPIIVSGADGRILEVNSMTAAEFGYGREELIGQSGGMLIPVRDHAARAQRREAILGEPHMRSLGPDLVCVRKDGSEFPAVGRLSPIRTSDGLQFITSLVNISERKQIEDDLKRANLATEAVNKELAAFAYSVAHDLRQPLRGMTGFSQILLEDFGPQLPQQAQDYLQRIQRASARMGQLIDDMLTLSRISRDELRRGPVNLSALAAEVLDELRKADPGRKVECAIAEGLEVSGDARLLRILLDNLLGNAWKFTGRAARPKIEFGVAPSDGERPFLIRDNGAGFDMAYADKLFGAFQRLHDNHEFPGTGIGLAIAQRIVNRHGGRIWAEGSVGQGATFYFTFSGRGGNRDGRTTDRNLVG